MKRFEDLAAFAEGLEPAEYDHFVIRNLSASKKKRVEHSRKAAAAFNGDSWRKKKARQKHPIPKIIPVSASYVAEKNCQGTCGGFLWNHFWRDR